MTKLILIGGTPRAGKTTLAQKISQKLSIPWVSADALGAIARIYTSDNKVEDIFPLYRIRKETGGGNDDLYGTYSTEEIVSSYLHQGETIEKAISVFVDYTVHEGWDYVIEGYQVTPKILSELTKKYPEVEAVVLINTNSNETLKRSKASEVQSDWVRDKTTSEETLEKIGHMISHYSGVLSEQCNEYGVKVVDMNENFEEKFDELFQELIK